MAKRISSGNPELDVKIEQWLSWDKNEKTLSAIKALVDKKDFDELSKILMKRLTFGTAGLRARMGPGNAALNDLVILQTSQGCLRYLQEQKLTMCGKQNCEQNALKTKGIVIGYDNRHNSSRFAELAATVFVNAGCPVILFSDVVATPMVSFSVRMYSCAAGIMVTASHNPKEDNGFKVYGSNGSQIMSPIDKHIQEHILKNLEPFPNSWDTSILKCSKLVRDPLNETVKAYKKLIENAILPEHKEMNEKMNLLFTYTAMHGVGYLYMKDIFKLIGVRHVPVDAQKDPDPEFPTVKFPNPEEGKTSLDLAIKTANQNSSNIIIANDPDADRMATAEKNQETGEWKVFTGNELGALLGWWCLYCFKIKYPEEPLSNAYMLFSTVSSMILKSMSKVEGFNVIETLTGFKWLGNKIDQLTKDNKKVIFAYEEAIGFLCIDQVLDKDGLSAAFQIATMSSFLYSQNQTITSKLDEIYRTYGYHITNNSYFVCEDAEKIAKIFNRIRNFHGPKKYPRGILIDKYLINTIRDLTTGYDNSQPDEKAILPVSKSNEMITFNFTNGLVCTLRTSGTEPKIKYYTEMCADPSNTNQEAIRETLNLMLGGIIDEFLEPAINGLIPQLKI